MGKSYDPVRLGAPDGRVAEVDGVTGRRYKATGGGMYEMHPRDAKAFKAEGAFTPTIGGPTIRGGYTCPGCGFKAVVRNCSRCGERCETDAERRTRLAAQAGAPVPRPTRVAGDVVMELVASLGTGEIREVGPVRPASGAVSAEIDRSFRASLARESARRTIYGGRA